MQRKSFLGFTFAVAMLAGVQGVAVAQSQPSASQNSSTSVST